MGSGVNTLLVLLLSLAAIAQSAPTIFPLKGGILKDDDNSCVYTVYIRTGSIWKGGTDSIIGADLINADGYGVRIPDLEAWGGLMGPDYNYYERGNLDVFSGKGPCLSSPPCKLNLTSDGSGDHHGWYCNYIEVTTTGPHSPCAQQLFTVEQWLATDVSPYQLSTVRDNCPATPEDSSTAPGERLVASI